MQRFLGSLTSTGEVDPDERLEGVRLLWADLPTSCRVGITLGGVPQWNEFSPSLVEAAFTLAAEYLTGSGTVVVTCRAEQLAIVMFEAKECHFRLVRTLFMWLPHLLYAINDEVTKPVRCLLVTLALVLVVLRRFSSIGLFFFYRCLY